MYYSIIRDIQIIWDSPSIPKIDRTVAFAELVDNGCIKTDIPLQNRTIHCFWRQNL